MPAQFMFVNAFTLFCGNVQFMQLMKLLRLLYQSGVSAVVMWAAEVIGDRRVLLITYGTGWSTVGGGTVTETCDRQSTWQIDRQSGLFTPTKSVQGSLIATEKHMPAAHMLASHGSCVATLRCAPEAMLTLRAQ
jgi:hypothetical protein